MGDGHAWIQAWAHASGIVGRTEVKVVGAAAGETRSPVPEKLASDAAWGALLAPHWDRESETIFLRNEEDLDAIMEERRAKLAESGSASGMTRGSAKMLDFPVEFVNVGHFAGEYEEHSRRVLGLGAGIERSTYDLGNYERHAAKNWDDFYRRNTDKFYKDRHYLLKDFAGLREKLCESKHHQDKIRILEIGCGVGNAILPLVEKYPHCDASGVDFADKAIDILNATSRKRGLSDQCRGWVHDITMDDPDDPVSFLASNIPTPVDICTMVFVLSAIAPDRMFRAVANVAGRLKPGGLLLFRDYAELDQAQLRFSKDQRLGHGNFVRQDGTRSFFFTLEGLSWLFERQCGLERVEAKYVKRIVLNRSKGDRMRRVFAHCVYRKPVN